VLVVCSAFELRVHCCACYCFPLSRAVLTTYFSPCLCPPCASLLLPALAPAPAPICCPQKKLQVLQEKERERQEKMRQKEEKRK